MLNRSDAYQIAIHLLLVVMALTVLGLVHKNRELQGRVAAPSQPPLVRGDTIAPVLVHNLDGRSELLDFSGTGREYMLFVFTTVCPACKENQSRWRSLYERFKGDYEIIGISLNEVSVSARYRESHALPFRVVVPEDIHGFARENKIYQVPFTAHVGSGGVVRSVWLGVLRDDYLDQFTALSEPVASRLVLASNVDF